MTFQARNITPTVGAEIEGFDPRAELDEQTRLLLKRVFDERAVLVFRDVELDPADQQYLVETLFLEEPAARLDPASRPRFSYVSNKEPDGGAPYGRLLFHADMMWSTIATQVPSLYAVEVEQPSVPTTFVSTTHAWDTLPADLRARVDGLHALHESGQQGRAPAEELLRPLWKRERSTTTPVAMRHPRTGDTMLYVCEQQTRRIVELPQAESDELLDALFAHLYRPEVILGHHWRTGDLVIWDNQLVQHGRPFVESAGPARTLRKIHAPRNLRDMVGAPEYQRAG